MPSPHPFSRRAADLVRTLVLWGYFTLGYLVLFLPRYVYAHRFATDRQAAFQSLNHRFFATFFRLLRGVVPRVIFEIGPEVKAIRGAVIVCNHRSYLDPILLISLFEKQKTIVKALFFKVPIFRWVLRNSGYLPASLGGVFASEILEQMESLGEFLAGGGNLFVFPEGTRGLGNSVARLEKGAFRIARRCGAPIEVLWLENTNKLFSPGRFLFNTCRPPVISVRQVGRLATAPSAAAVYAQMEQVREMFERQVDGG